VARSLTSEEAGAVSIPAAPPPGGSPAADYPVTWVAEHVRTRRRNAAMLGEIREIVFGAQDGLVSTLAVVATVAGASNEGFPIVVAGLASAVAGIFSMSAGEYLGSISQTEIFEAQIAHERIEVEERLGEAEAEVAFMLAEEGLPDDEAARIAAVLARHPKALLHTMVSKELGIEVGSEHGSPVQGAVLMGTAFGLSSTVPVVPFLLLPTWPALPVATVATCAVLFAIGVLKSRWTERSALWSGLQVLALAAIAGIAGYLFGTALPTLLAPVGLSG
jgi:VIT1/CCC1 family predicted Fe2+/Mn2+ transporter